MDSFNLFSIINALPMIIALIVAVVGHEIMHGFVAYKYGDNTAKNENRLSINPIRHVDLMGTVIVPALLYISNAGFLFGWAKPVPVNMSIVIRNGGYLAAIYVALAGITYNTTLALSSALILNGLSLQENSLEIAILIMLLYQIISINVVLAFFNLLPIPPLDGFNALGFFLAKFGLTNLANKLFEYQKYGMVLLILIIATPISNYIFYPVRVIIRALMP